MLDRLPGVKPSDAGLSVFSDALGGVAASAGLGILTEQLSVLNAGITTPNAGLSAFADVLGGVAAKTELGVLTSSSTSSLPG